MSLIANAREVRSTTLPLRITNQTWIVLHRWGRPRIKCKRLRRIVPDFSPLTPTTVDIFRSRQTGCSPKMSRETAAPPTILISNSWTSRRTPRSNKIKTSGRRYPRSSWAQNPVPLSWTTPTTQGSSLPNSKRFTRWRKSLSRRCWAPQGSVR